VSAVRDGTPGPDRIAELLDELRGTLPPREAAQVDELVAAIVAFYGAGLAELGRVADAAGEAGAKLLEAWAGSAAGASLVALHGLAKAALPVAREHSAAGEDERCELCGAPLAPAHSHLVSVEDRALLCACRPCTLLFTHQGAGAGRLRAVSERRVYRGTLRSAIDPWELLEIPVGLAFVFESSAAGRPAAFYPGPAGATESLLPLATWRELAASHPVLATLAADVEAVLLHRNAGGETEGYLVPIDTCYELTGLVRRRWRGFDGGDEVRADVAAFFSQLRAACRPAPGGAP
jgi:hypothetical protein